MQEEAAAAGAGPAPGDVLDRQRSRRWRLPFTWLGLLALAWCLFELTHNPALGAVIVCLKFGWEDFRAAGWLWRCDQERWRRRSTFWLYFAWGVWKTALVALLMSIGFALVAPRNPLPPAARDVLRLFLSTFLTTVVGFGLSAMMTAVAVAFAWSGGVRLWLDSAVHRARRLDCWPPTPLCVGRHNRLGHLLLTAIGLGFLVFLVLLLAAAAGGGFGFAVCSILSVSAPVLLLVVRELISRKVWAESPEECWQEPFWDEEVEPFQENETDIDPDGAPRP